MPRIFDKQIINPHLTRTTLVDPTSIKKGIRVKHLGFGDQKTGVYTKRKKLSSTPWGAFGRFDSSTKTEITIQSPARYGDSGGPVFLKTTSGEALLIGVTKSTSVLPSSNVSLDDEYTGITKAVPIFHVLSMLHSEKMKSQIKTAKIQIQKIHDDYQFN